MDETIIDRIIKIKDVLPKKQQKLCNYLVMNYEQVGIMTIAELAHNAEVGTTTVLRLIHTLNINSFSDFKKEILNATLVHKTTAYRDTKQRLAWNAGDNNDSAFQDTVLNTINVLDTLCSKSNITQFEIASDLLANADMIYLLGLRSSKAMALCCGYAFSTFHTGIVQLSNDPSFIFDRIALVSGTKNVLLVFSAWPCTKRTIEAAEFWHEKGLPLILITNTSLNPIAKFADAMLDTDSVNRTSGNAAVCTLIEALTTELGRRKDDAKSNIEKVEEILNKKDIILSNY